MSSSPRPSSSDSSDTLVAHPRREQLRSVIARRKREMKPKAPHTDVVPDPYATANASKHISKGSTAIVYDLAQLSKHKCEWDPDYPEKPERLQAVIARCLALFPLCEMIPNPLRTDLLKRIGLKHSTKLPLHLQRLCQIEDLKKLEKEASHYDAIYINKHTYDCAMLALSSVLNLSLEVASKSVQNGIALVRPPGHHAMRNEFNGYCFFNNVAIAVETCIQEKLAQRVLIVDVDVHHGQGIQRMFYDRKDVLYFSIHRYEHGAFWPNLRESNFNYIGEGEGLGYNINVPLNATGLTDSEYLAIVFNILLPIAYEFNPDLLFVCAGYDSCMGDEKGEMDVTPGFYGHLISLLSGLAQGRMVVVLEGGYFLPSLAEGVHLTLKSLLGGPCPLLPPLKEIHPSVIQTICDVRRMLIDRWNCFKICELEHEGTRRMPDDHRFQICYFGKPEKPPYSTQKCYPLNSKSRDAYYTKLVEGLSAGYDNQDLNRPVVYVYDDVMLNHKPPAGDHERPERPERISSIRNVFNEFGIQQRLKHVEIDIHNIYPFSPHSSAYLCNINKNITQTKDIYTNEHTEKNVIVAVSGLLTVVDKVMKNEARSGVAVIRPPGHHAEKSRPSGFCFINNVAVAARYLQHEYNVKRILIIDFDIHHGNGTQNMFYESNNVMYISIHRDDDGKFFPPNSPRDYRFDGHGLGKGYNLNIPFSKDKMGDTEYLATFHNIILPAAYAYGPQVVLVSAGFDAGINDPLGGYGVHPETFGHFIKMLSSLAEGRLILALEGGYNLTTTSLSMAICTKALLGDPVLMPPDLYLNFSEAAVDTIRKVTHHFQQYFGVFKVNKRLGRDLKLVRNVDEFEENSYDLPLIAFINADQAEDNSYVEQQMEKLNLSH